MAKESFQAYFEGIKGKYGTEFTFRTPLENLLNEIKPNTTIEITHEPKRKSGFGAPDFKIEIDGMPIGYIETKEIGTNLDKTLKSDQIKKYLKVCLPLEKCLMSFRNYLQSTILRAKS